MREIYVDLSNDNNNISLPQAFCGYAGEHNATTLKVKLPSRMVNLEECSGYKFIFQTSDGSKISSPLISTNKLSNGILPFLLTDQLTQPGKLLFNVVAILVNQNTVTFKEMTTMAILYIGDSPDGIETLFADDFKISDGKVFAKTIIPTSDTQILSVTDIPFEPDYVFFGNKSNITTDKSIKKVIVDINAYKSDNPCFTVEYIATANYVIDGGKNIFNTGGVTIATNSINIDFSKARNSNLKTSYLRQNAEYYCCAVKIDYDEDVFDINGNGVLFLKPEYRGKGNSLYPLSVSDNGAGVAGSKINDLPDELWLPENVAGIDVVSLADGMFMGNERIKKIHLIDRITAIPDYLCRKAINLQKVFNTENVTSIGNSAFQLTSLQEIYLPNVNTLSNNVFNNCQKLKTVVISDTLTEITTSCFSGCSALEILIGGNSVNTVDDLAFFKTYSLKNIKGIVNGLINGGSNSSIGTKSLVHSRITTDWAAVTNSGCQTEETSTPLQYNSAYNEFVNYQNNHTFSERINSLGVTFNQNNTDWSNTVIGSAIGAASANKKYGSGCVLLACMHAYCALKGYTNLQTPMAVEQQMLQDAIELDNEAAIELDNEAAISHEEAFRNAIANYDYYHVNGVEILETLGVTCKTYDRSNLSSPDYVSIPDYVSGLYTEIAKSNTCIVINVDSSEAAGGHEYMIYGVNEDGELLIVDSSSFLGKELSETTAVFGKMLPQSFVTRTFTAVSLSS